MSLTTFSKQLQAAIVYTSVLITLSGMLFFFSCAQIVSWVSKRTKASAIHETRSPARAFAPFLAHKQTVPEKSCCHTLQSSVASASVKTRTGRRHLGDHRWTHSEASHRLSSRSDRLGDGKQTAIASGTPDSHVIVSHTKCCSSCSRTYVRGRLMHRLRVTHGRKQQAAVRCESNQLRDQKTGIPQSLLARSHDGGFGKGCLGATNLEVFVIDALVGVCSTHQQLQP
jgi:hypothetical protein